MGLFFNRDQAQREGAIQLLQGTRWLFPAACQEWIIALEQGAAPAVVGQEVAQSIQRTLEERDAKLRTAVMHANNSQFKLQTAFQEIHALRNDPIRQQLQEAQTEITHQRERAEKAEWQITSQRMAHDRAQCAQSDEIARLQAAIADLNRVIARQHQQLAELLNDEKSHA